MQEFAFVVGFLAEPAAKADAEVASARGVGVREGGMEFSLELLDLELCLLQTWEEFPRVLVLHFDLLVPVDSVSVLELEEAFK